ncbi:MULTISPECIES: HAD family hydrolase [Pectobacterium]|uniref:hypothetical protein n=1 Tax=Pectobacterium TaxID=122277 RepID=UPI0013738FBC|nr:MULTISPECIES: hypothetical protein [Pectobacterium]QHP81219.1 hypothetical protein EO763_15555 [Pectobacterium odoriferum]GKW04889.1 hypothetical protein PEC301877_37020 [Pectobacterium carotovorum subsp. carotovorum]
MLFFSEILIFWGLFVFTPPNYTNTFPCSPIPFIQNGMSENWSYFEDHENSQYERVGYDFDDTILISQNGSVIDGKPMLNFTIVKQLLLDIKLKRKVYLISNRNEKQRGEIINLMRTIVSPQALISINIILLGGTNELKAKYIESNKIDVYYGDSDSDMVYAIMGGAKPIRVLRNTISKDKHGANIGIFKEFIMGCSQRAS